MRILLLLFGAQNALMSKKEKNKMNDETQMDDEVVMMIGLLLIGQSS